MGLSRYHPLASGISGSVASKPRPHSSSIATVLSEQPSVTAGVKEAGWEPEEETLPPYRLSIDRVMLPPTQENLHTLMQDAWQALNTHEDSWPFREPVDAEDVLDYYDIIKVRCSLRSI